MLQNIPTGKLSALLLHLNDQLKETRNYLQIKR